ncbi:MAG TPA: type VI secretion system baseplate subunit TssE [Acidobacteriaceae bacterium]
MARTNQMPVMQSVLDRLSERPEWPGTHTASVRMLKESIRRDLEELLNTRRQLTKELEGYEAARSSVINYGLEDLNSITPLSRVNAQELQRAVQRCIAEYEPRLLDVSVTVEGGGDLLHREVRLHIEATIPVYPSAEIVSFDTMLDLASGTYSIG